MKIRKAEEKDIPRLLALLGQVLQIHAEIRPDVFIPGTTKYTVCELTELLKQEDKPIYVAVNEDDVCMGYAFCQMQEQPFSTNMVPFKSLFIDDLCVDQQARGHHRENQDPINESRRGAFPVGRLLGGFFVKHEQALIISSIHKQKLLKCFCRNVTIHTRYVDIYCSRNC